MKLKRKPAEVEVFRLTMEGSITVAGFVPQAFNRGDWLVIKDNAILIMSEAELRKEYDFPMSRKPLRRAIRHTKPTPQTEPISTGNDTMQAPTHNEAA